jgi:hypothetical protein
VWIVRPDSNGLIVAPPDTGPGSSTGSLAPTTHAVRDAQGKVMISFTGTLQFTPDLSQGFTDLPDATSPFAISDSAESGFYRARK